MHAYSWYNRKVLSSPAPIYGFCARNEDDIIPPPLFYSVRVQSFALLPTNSKATRQIFGSDYSWSTTPPSYTNYTPQELLWFRLKIEWTGWNVTLLTEKVRGVWFDCNFRQRTWSNCTYSVTVISVLSVLSRQRSSCKLIFNSVVYFSNDTRLWDWKESDRVLILSWLSSDLRLETPWVSNLFSSRINTSLKRKMSSSEEV